jgi:hypothetical protein
MAYDAAQARQELLDDVAAAIDQIGVALAALGEAYEQLDEVTADRLEDELFRAVQTAYGRAQRTHSGFAQRHALPVATFAPATDPHPSTGVKGLIEGAVGAAASADHLIAELQDSLRPVDVGDAELRAGLSEVRRLLDGLPGRARRFVSVLGR